MTYLTATDLANPRSDNSLHDRHSITCFYEFLQVELMQVLIDGVDKLVACEKLLEQRKSIDHMMPAGVASAAAPTKRWGR